MYGCDMVDTAEHLVLYCPKYDGIRQRTEFQELTPEKLLKYMLLNSQNWNSQACYQIIRGRIEDERERERHETGAPDRGQLVEIPAKGSIRKLFIIT